MSPKDLTVEVLKEVADKLTSEFIWIHPRNLIDMTDEERILLKKEGWDDSAGL